MCVLGQIGWPPCQVSRGAISDQTTMEKEGAGLESDVAEVRAFYRTGRTREASWRESQLKGLRKFLLEKEADIFLALKQDLGKHQAEAYRDEVGVLLKTIKLALASLKDWMSSKKVRLPLIAYPSTAELVPEPLGLVLIFSSWNFPFGLSLEPLIGATAAGNTVVLKPSELAPASSALLEYAAANYLDSRAIKVIQGDAHVGQQLLNLRWDKIFFTGSPRVGRIVLSAAAKFLTPVTMELGGKCPAIFDFISNSWCRKKAIERILGAKFGACSGQACIAIDYILVENQHLPVLMELLLQILKEMFGVNPRECNSMARIINKQNFHRLMNLMEEPRVKSSIVYGGFNDEDNLFIGPTIIVNPPLDAEVMTEEIFGPLLPIITLEKIEHSIEFISSRPKPLALYAFTNDEKLKRRIISETSSGTVTFNDAIIQYAVDALPFGGTGESGFGRYHGKFSFDAFSHEKGVLKRGFLIDFWFRFPPWNDHKLLLFRQAYIYDYFGLLLVILGLKKSK